MEPFDFYLKNESVKKIIPNKFRAKSLINDAKIRLEFLRHINIKKFPKIYFEHLYDIIRDYCDAILFAGGFKSFSHEASISYLSKKGFDFISLKKLDLFRYKRNGSKYYGEPISIEDAEELNELYLNIKNKLNKILQEIK